MSQIILNAIKKESSISYVIKQKFSIFFVEIYMLNKNYKALIFFRDCETLNYTNIQLSQNTIIFVLTYRDVPKLSYVIFCNCIYENT